MLIKDLLEKQNPPTAFGLVSIAPEASFSEALSLMGKMKIHHLLVTESDKLKGLISDRDILEHGLLADKTAFDSSKRVRDLLKTDVTCIQETSELNSIFAEMKKSSVDAILVLQEDKIKGIVTETDLINILDTIARSEEGDHKLEISKIYLSDPLVQGIMKTLADIGI